MDDLRAISIFSGLDEAVSYFAPRYRVENEQQRAILREALDSEMEHGGGGRVLRHTGICMRVRWSPQDASPR